MSVKHWPRGVDNRMCQDSVMWSMLKETVGQISALGLKINK